MDVVGMIYWFACGLFLLAICKITIKYIFTRRCTSNVRLDGKTVLITGANSGIGKATAKDLARRGARVIMACRNFDKAKKAREEIIQETGNANIVVEKVDLSDLQSVREAVRHILEREQRLDILINNAAMSGGEKVITRDGFELYFASSYIGPFLFTNLLLPLLEKSAPSRIVNVSSMIHTRGKIEFDNLQCEKTFSGSAVYCKSKLANILFTRELSKRLENVNVTVNCLHPGFIFTNIFNSMPRVMFYPLFLLTWWFSISEDDGCQTTVYCAVEKQLDEISGEYFSNCKKSTASDQANDDALAKKLWEVSERLTGLA